MKTMNEYMVIVKLPSEPPEDFISLIPRQREKVTELLDAGMVSSYILSLDRSRLWVTITAETEEEVREIVDSFPLRGYMQVEIRPLAFRNIGTRSLYQMSLN
jgi:muconolactone delta-isomerase